MEDFNQLSDPQGHTGDDTWVGERGITLSSGRRQRVVFIDWQCAFGSSRTGNSQLEPKSDENTAREPIERLQGRRALQEIAQRH